MKQSVCYKVYTCMILIKYTHFSIYFSFIYLYTSYKRIIKNYNKNNNWIIIVEGKHLYYQTCQNIYVNKNLLIFMFFLVYIIINEHNIIRISGRYVYESFSWVSKRINLNTLTSIFVAAVMIWLGPVYQRIKSHVCILERIVFIKSYLQQWKLLYKRPYRWKK